MGCTLTHPRRRGKRDKTPPRNKRIKKAKGPFLVEKYTARKKGERAIPHRQTKAFFPWTQTNSPSGHFLTPRKVDTSRKCLVAYLGQTIQGDQGVVPAVVENVLCCLVVSALQQRRLDTNPTRAPATTSEPHDPGHERPRQASQVPPIAPPMASPRGAGHRSTRREQSDPCTDSQRTNRSHSVASL